MSGDEEASGIEYPTGTKVWTRLEPRSRNARLTTSLRAAVEDPLWLLGRQWQVGEFRGEDAGSPVRATTEVEHDRVTRLQLGDDPPVAYDHRTDGPLETLVEREAVVTDDAPPGLRLRAEAGQAFRRLLAAAGASFDPADAPASLRLSPPDDPLDAADARYVDLMADRALDGHAVYEAVQAGTLELPGVDPAAVDTAATQYADWYEALYDEPSAALGEAWDAERFEYRFAVATGEGERETVFDAEEYPGGRLDWHAFSPGGSLESSDDDDAPADESTTTTTIDRLPTNVDFPGMPAARWWEFEDASVNLEELSAAPEGLNRLVMLEFVLVYGNDWFKVPVDTPVGTLSRVTELAITDTFGITTRDVPAANGAWNLFMADLGDTAAGPDKGLFLPPVLGEVAESDPVEEVVLMRDEMANLAFGIEERVESPVGSPLDREAFHPPRLAVGSMRPAATAEAETLVLENVGSVELEAAGWSVAVVDTGGGTVATYTLGDLAVQPGASLTVATGPPPDADAAASESTADAYWGRDAPALGEETAVHLVLSDPAGDVVERVRIPRLEESLLPAYRLASRVPDHWYPMKPTGPDADRAYRYRLARLLDADALDDDVSAIPQPLGEILRDSADVDIYEEEVTRAGLELTRSYQLARWLGGSTHLWSGRRARTGRGEGASGLRFDYLDE